MCILDLAKIQLNGIGEGQIDPGQKIYELPNNIYFVCPFFKNYFFVLKERPDYKTNTVVVWPRKVIIAVCKNCSACAPFHSSDRCN